MTNRPVDGKRDAEGKSAPASIHSVQRRAVFACELPPGLR